MSDESTSRNEKPVTRPRPTSSWVEVGEWRSHILRVGRGPTTLVWFPAVGDSSFSATAVFSILAAELDGLVELVFCDPPGYGFSRDALLSMKEQMRWAIDVAGSFDGPLLIVGNSSGGVAAAAVAAAMADRVRALILVGWPDLGHAVPPTERLCPETLEDTRLLLERSWHTPPPVPIERIHAQVSSSAFQEHVRSLPVGEARNAYDAYPGPVYFFGGDSDRLVAPDVLRASAQRRNRAELTIIDQCGHYPHREQPRTFAAALTECVKYSILGE